MSVVLFASHTWDPDLSRETMRAHLIQTEKDSDHYLAKRAGQSPARPPR